MSHRMHEISDRVRVGRLSNGALDVEVWESPRGWEGARDEDPIEVLIPADAVDSLFEFLR